MKKIISFIIILFFISIPIQQSYAQQYFPFSHTDGIIQDNYQYIIITDSSLAHVFQRLIDYKSQFLTAKLVTLDDILQNQTYHGRDTQEKIRSFISHAHKNWNTRFVLLGGDVSIIPYRVLHTEMIDWEGEEKISEIPSDAYYACLDGSWDEDADFIFGEQENDSVKDEADYYAEVSVGRAPVETGYEASVFVNKVISFETSEKPFNITLHQSGLNPQSNPSSSKIIDNCLKWIPRDSYFIEKLYSVLYNITVEKWIQSFNKGKLIIQHAGNGNEFQYDLDNNEDNEVWTIQNISELRNNFYPIHLSLACHSGDFTINDCIAEKMLLFPYGGTSACIFNTDFGATDNKKAYLYSGEILEYFFYELFEGDSNHLGVIYQKAKEHFADEAYHNPKYRWCYHSTNLLGDPEMPIFGQRSCETSLILSVDDDFDENTAGWNETRFNSVQRAIDEVENEGTILVYNGDYKEHITISKSVYLYGTNRNFEGDESYSGLSTIIGDNTDNVITVNANNVFIDGLIIRKSSKNHSAIYFNHVNNSFIYRSYIVGNAGNGIYLDNSNHCHIYDSSISFNNNHGIFLNHSDKNVLEELEIAYNKKNGIYLKNSDENSIMGSKSSWSSPFDFYGSKILHKNQELDLSNRDDLVTFIQLFLSKYSDDLTERVFYYPTRPPTSTDNIVTYHYGYIVNNKNGITLDESYKNTIKYNWIETKNEGTGIHILKSSQFPNHIYSNFLYNNEIGMIVNDSSIANILLNNFYNNYQPFIINNATGLSMIDTSRFSFFLGGNVIINEQTNLPRFRWIFIDKTNDALFIDLIALILFTGYVGVNLVLSVIPFLYTVLPYPFLISLLTTLLISISTLPHMLKYIKINQPPPFFDFSE